MGLNLAATGGQFSIRNLGAGLNSPVFIGTQTITWVINNSGEAIVYTAPDGSVETTGDDQADLWVGGTRVFDEVVATTGINALTDLKFAFTAGTGAIDIDNLLADPVPGVPVLLSPTSVGAVGFTVNWVPVGGANAYEVDIANDPGFSSGLAIYPVTGGQTQSLIVSGLSPQTEYYCRVRSVSNFAVGAWRSGNSMVQSITTGPGTLPVKFVNVKVTQKNNGINIEWSNLTESDVIEYVVERSGNGADFDPIRNVGPRSNNGSKEDYIVLDEDYLEGISYYRIKAKEFGAPNSYSNIVQISSVFQKHIQITNDEGIRTLLIKGRRPKAEKFIIGVYSATGQLVYNENISIQAGEFSKKIYLPINIAAGIYYFTIKGSNIKESKSIWIR
jgi:hypothetical protein